MKKMWQIPHILQNSSSFNLVYTFKIIIVSLLALSLNFDLAMLHAQFSAIPLGACVLRMIIQLKDPLQVWFQLVGLSSNTL